MPATHITLTIPRQRYGQLMSIMDATGAATISETLGRLFKTFAAQGHVEHELPGIAIDRIDNGLAIQLEANERTGLSLEGARVLADAIRTLATGERKVAVTSEHHDFAVSRKGNGVRVTLPLAGKPRAYPIDVALELAEILEGAAQ